MTARVRVPASSSNLGSGFDCVGIAIDRWLTASVTIETNGIGFSIRRRGKLSTVKVRADQDLFTRGFRAACSAGGGILPTGVAIDASSDIPVGCGLGSSAAAIVAGALLADGALGLGLSRDDVLETLGLSAILSAPYFVQAQALPFDYQMTVLRGNATKIDALLLREYLYRGQAIPSPRAPSGLVLLR